MKKEYKELFDSITPDEKLKNIVLEKLENKQVKMFSPKKLIAIAAAFVLIVTGGLGIYRVSTVDFHNNEDTSNIKQSNLDFSIIAFAKENENNINILSSDDVTLTEQKITLNEDSDGYTVNIKGYDEGLSVRSDYDIDTVIFECENGLMSYLDDPLIDYLISQNKYYCAIIPISEEQYNEYNNIYSNSVDKTDAEIKEEFVKKIFNSKDCSQYIYTDDFDISKFTTNEYSVDVSDNTGDDEYNYDYCIWIRDRAYTSVALQDNTKTIVAKTYQAGDEIGNISYHPDYAVNYLLENPTTDFSKLPTDIIKITVKFKNGQSASKEIVTQFDSNGVLTMKCK